MYSRRNSIKSPASGPNNVSEHGLSQVWRVFEVVCAYISVFLLSEWWKSQCSPAYIAAKFM